MGALALLAPRTRWSRRVQLGAAWRSPVAGSGYGWEWTSRRRSCFQWGDTTTDWSAADDGYAIADRCVRWPREELSLSLSLLVSPSDSRYPSGPIAITFALISRICADKGIFDDRRGALNVSAGLAFVERRGTRKLRIAIASPCGDDGRRFDRCAM